MRETIIYAPGCSASRLYKEAAFFGRELIGYRVMNSEQLSAFVMARCAKPMPLMCSSDEEVYMLYRILRDDRTGYFTFAVFRDAVNLAAGMRRIRSLITGDEDRILHERLPEGVFTQKNRALLEVYDRYTRMKRERGIMDRIDCLRYAAEEAGPVEDAGFIILKEYPLSPLEEKLLSAAAHTWQEMSLCDLLPENPDKPETVYIRAYDLSNEMENVLSEIYEKGYPMDTCTVIAADTRRYSQLLYDYARIHDIPATYGTGLPVTLSRAADLLVRYRAYYDEYNGVEGLRQMIMADSFDLPAFLGKTGMDRKLLEGRKGFDGFIRICGQLRLDGTAEDERKLRNHEEVLRREHQKRMTRAAEKDEHIQAEERRNITDEDTVLQAVRIFSGELRQGPAYFVRTYTAERRTDTLEYDLDTAGAEWIAEQIEAYTENTDGGSWLDIYDELMNAVILKQQMRPGCLHITSVHDALLGLRQHNYVVGMSADVFPGSAREDYLFLDDDLRLITPDPMYTSERMINRKKEEFETLLKTAEHLGTDMTLSYASYNMAAIKAANPSSVLFEHYRTQYSEASMDAFSAVMKKTDFFSGRINPAREIGRALGESSIGYEAPVPQLPERMIRQRRFSPLAVEAYFACGKMFYYERILGIYEEDEDDPLRVIPANDFGSLAHALFEDLAEQMVSEEQFEQMASAAFDDYLRKRIPVHIQDAVKEKKDFVRMMVNAYADDPKNTVLAAEEELSAVHASGIEVRGYPDRVEREPNGLNLIADFKTGRKLRHKDDDVESCLQVMLYAFILTKHDIDIRTCVYRYLRLRRKVRIDYTQANIARMNEMLDELSTALREKRFERMEKPDPAKAPCSYCRFQRLCGLAQEVKS